MPRHWRTRSRGSTSDDGAVVYERQRQAPPPWPRAIRSLRNALFDERFLASAPSSARQGSWLICATARGKSIGYAWTVRAVGDTAGAYIEEAGVLPEYQGRGIGTQLLVETARWMAEHGCTWLGTTSLADVLQARREAWFTRIGFEPEAGDMFAAHPEKIVRHLS